MTFSNVFLLLANHLWQSTFFVFVAAVLALVFREAPARTRYWIWWIASLKFLVPFSLLVSIGGLLSWRTTSPAPTGPSVPAVVLEQVAQPFTSDIVWTTVSGVADTPSDASAGAVFAVVLGAWAFGCGVTLLRWWKRWRRARGLVGRRGSAAFIDAGRELAALRRLEQKTGAGKPLAILASASAIEPSVFGLFRPVLVWPAALSARLADEELEAILLHELSHVRRCDNLTAALQMVIEAVFWFHPLVWWIGVRLVEEREKACDENVLRWGGASRIYAEGILKVCEFCLESPLACAAGVTGSDLKRRIEEIMRNRIVHRLSWSAAALLASVAITALAAPIAVGILYAAESQPQLAEAIRAEASAMPETAQTPGPREDPAVPRTSPGQEPNLDLLAQVEAILAPRAQETFDVVSVRVNTGTSDAGGGRGGRGGGRGDGRGDPYAPSWCGGMVQVNPGRFVATNVTLYRLVTLAYGKNCRLSGEQGLLAGGEDWTRSEAFDVQATIPEGVPGYTQQQLLNGEAPRLQAMIRNLLEERFKLSLHRDMKDIPIYNLVLVKMGRIKLSEDQTPPAPAAPPPGLRERSAPLPRGSFGVGVDPQAGKVRLFASAIPISTIINFYQGNVRRMVVDKTGLQGLYDIPQVELDVGPFDLGPGAVTVWPEIMQQLGLKMDPTRGPAEVLVIDRVEKPSEN